MLGSPQRLHQSYIWAFSLMRQRLALGEVPE